MADIHRRVCRATSSSVTIESVTEDLAIRVRCSLNGIRGVSRVTSERNAQSARKKHGASNNGTSAMASGATDLDLSGVAARYHCSRSPGRINGNKHRNDIVHVAKSRDAKFSSTTRQRGAIANPDRCRGRSTRTDRQSGKLSDVTGTRLISRG